MANQASTKHSNPPRVVVFASGRGSNLEALLSAQADGKLNSQIVAVVCNIEGAACIEVAKKYNIKAHVIPNLGIKRVEHETLILNALKAYDADWIVLAGYMRVFSAQFIENFTNENGLSNIINIHPSLLPAFPGIESYQQAFKHGVKVTGATVHLVTTGVDEGPILAQSTIEIRDDDSVESLIKRGLENEHRLFVSTLQKLFTKSWTVQNTGGRFKILWDSKGSSL